ncbi:MAG: hypothetical protein HXX13_10130 [Bacteroidetes bacterium]|nr:hypothetical protein [Bacteroidota bacterium]
MKKAGYLFCKVSVAFLLILIFNSTPAKCQFYMWNPQKALTDSAADNINPTIAFYYGSDNLEHSILFWERSTDLTSTSIWYKCLDGGNPQEPTELIASPGVHFTNPKVVVLSNSIPAADSSFMLFFESDVNGDKDLYSMKYYNNGSFTAPQLFSGLPGDDKNLTLVWGYSIFAVWENQGRILKSDWDYMQNSFSAPEIMSTEGSHDPTGSEMNIYWIKDTLSGSKVVYLKREYISGNWIYTGPYDLENEGTNSNLEACKGFFMFGSQDYTVWQNTQSLSPTQIRFAFNNSPIHEVLDLGSPNFNYSSPDVMDFPMIIKMPTFLAFVTDSLGNDEVMVNSGYSFGLDNPTNLSNYEGPDRNPQFFGTVSAYIFQANLLWESLRDGHWTIFYSHYDMTIGLQNDLSGKSLEISPNPSSEVSHISLPANSRGSLNIYNSFQILVKSIRIPGNGIEAIKEIGWDGMDDQGNKVPAGAYIIRYVSDNGAVSAKLIRY